MARPPETDSWRWRLVQVFLKRVPMPLSPFAFRQRVSSPGTGLKGDALFACPSIVWPGEKQSYLLKYGFNAGIFVHTVHTLMTEREREESAMAEAAGVFTWKKKRNTVRDQERRTLLEGLSQTRLLIAQAYSGFNTAHDPDLIESYVFEINALQARYSYLLRRVKELDEG